LDSILSCRDLSYLYYVLRWLVYCCGLVFVLNKQRKVSKEAKMKESQVRVTVTNGEYGSNNKDVEKKFKVVNVEMKRWRMEGEWRNCADVIIIIMFRCWERLDLHHLNGCSLFHMKMHPIPTCNLIGEKLFLLFNILREKQKLIYNIYTIM